MPTFKYLIIGGGMTADAAVQGIREMDSSGSIGLISMESDPPYDRPPLTKGLWKDKTLDSIWRSAAKQNAQLHLGRMVKSLDVKQKRATDGQGTVYSFEKLLLATGGEPRVLPFGEAKIIYYRTVADYRKLRALTEKGKRFTVIGGGFIGSEIAAALAMNGKKVTLVFPGPSIGNRIYPQALSKFLNNYYSEKGVTVAPGETATGLEERNSELVIKTKSGREIAADYVVAGLGIEPSTGLASEAGLKVENGIIVDAFLQTSAPDVFAAGDVAAFHNPALDQRLRVEHEDNANTMGKIAGRNMAGKRESYDHLPFFYSDLFDLGYEAVGELDSRLETVADWKTENREGIIYYLRDGRVRGVLLWNTWGQVDAAREIIASRRVYQAAQLKNLLPKAG
jgi:3-phenylpropionate/trans-cinnamate dioxygenase ferredoxin reductase component